MPARRRRFAAGALALVAMASCGSDGGPVPSAEPFCDELRTSGLVGLEIRDAASAGATAARFEQLVASAPVDIRDEWRRLTELFRTVGTLDPADPGFGADVLAEVGRSTTAATEVTTWVQRRCDLDLDATTAVAPTSTAAG